MDEIKTGDILLVYKIDKTNGCISVYNDKNNKNRIQSDDVTQLNLGYVKVNNIVNTGDISLYSVENIEYDFYNKIKYTELKKVLLGLGFEIGFEENTHFEDEYKENHYMFAYNLSNGVCITVETYNVNECFNTNDVSNKIDKTVDTYFSVILYINKGDTIRNHVGHLKNSYGFDMKTINIADDNCTVKFAPIHNIRKYSNDIDWHGNFPMLWNLNDLTNKKYSIKEDGMCDYFLSKMQTKIKRCKDNIIELFNMGYIDRIFNKKHECIYTKYPGGQERCEYTVNGVLVWTSYRDKNMDKFKSYNVVDNTIIEYKGVDRYISYGYMIGSNGLLDTDYVYVIKDTGIKKLTNNEFRSKYLKIFANKGGN